MTKIKFEQGDYAYTPRGEYVKVLDVWKDKYLVCYVSEESYGGNYYEEPYGGESSIGSFIVKELFTEFKTKKHPDFIYAENHLKELKQQIIDANSELGRIKSQIKEEYKYFENDKEIIGVLKNIKAYKEGRLKYIVTFNFTKVEVNKIEDMTFESKIRLCSLYGMSNFDLQWRLNYFTDSSGSERESYLFETEEEARAKQVELANIIFANKIKEGYSLELHVLQFYKKEGIEVPKELVKQSCKWLEEHRQNMVDNAKKALDEKIKDLDEVVKFKGEQK